MSSVPFWDPATSGYAQGVGLFDWSPWDVCKLGGQTLPGLVTINGDGFKQELDVKAASGVGGANMTIKSLPPQDLTLVVRMWMPEQLAIWAQIVPILAPPAGKGKSPPLALEHPATTIHRINAMMIETISLLVDAQPKGCKQATIKGKAWSKPIKTGTTTPKNAKGGGLPPTVVDVKNQAWNAQFHAQNPGDAGPPPPPPPSFYDAGPNAK